jgi:hypothetical protein
MNPFSKNSRAAALSSGGNASAASHIGRQSPTRPKSTLVATASSGATSARFKNRAQDFRKTGTAAEM